MTELETRTVDVPGAVLHYDVRPGEASDAPTLVMFGSPMDASGFTALAEQFRDRTVVTYDPRGTGRSERTDGTDGTERTVESTPETHADDLHRLLNALGGGPVDLFASSGGAINALALVARHPEQVRTLVAHEPPASQVVDDREEALAAVTAICERYQRDGFGPAMAMFITLVGLKGPVPADFGDQPVDPANFGLPTEDDGTRNDPLLGQTMRTCNFYVPDFDALRAASTRIVVGVGAESEGELAHRGGMAVAERLGAKPVTFPSHHGGFLDPAMGWGGEPAAFAVKLREVLDTV